MLRLETKGCAKDEVGGLAWEAYVIYLIWGGEEERLWGIPWEIPNWRERDEARRGSVCFGRS